MRKKFRRYLVMSGVIVVASLIWIFRPYASPDPDSVSKHLRELEEPFQNVKASYYLDGGSVGIRIVDSSGHKADFCLRADQVDRDQKYKRLYYGSLHYRDGPSTEIPHPSDTILRLMEIVRTAEGLDSERDIAVAAVSGRWRDYGRFVFRRLVTQKY